MTTRQVIGKRRSISAVQARGVERREVLIAAAKELMGRYPLEDVSFRVVAQAARVPQSSAYHFYANKYDLFSAVASEVLILFVEAYSKPVPKEKAATWQDLMGEMVDRSIAIFRTDVVARELIIGPKTAPEIIPDDAWVDERLYSAIIDQLNEHFIVPEVPDLAEKLKFASTIFKSLLTVSLREGGEITDAIAGEAKRACCGYLSTYLPASLPRRFESLGMWDTFPL